MSRCKIVATCLMLLSACGQGVTPESNNPFIPDPPVVPDPPIIIDPPDDPDPEPPIIIDPAPCLFEVEPNGNLGQGPTILVEPGFFQNFCGDLTYSSNPVGWDNDSYNFFFPPNMFGHGLILSVTVVGEIDSGIEVFVGQWDFSPPPPMLPYSHVIVHSFPNGNGFTTATNIHVPYHDNGFNVGVRNLASPHTQYQLSVAIVGIIP